MAVKTYFPVGGRSKQMRKGSRVSVEGYARKLHKLYASVNGQSKLIFDDGDSQPVETIIYYQDDPAMPYKTISIPDTQLSLITGWYSGTPRITQVTLNGEYLPTRWFRGVRIGSCVESLENSFLGNQEAGDVPGMAMPLFIPDTVGDGAIAGRSTSGFLFESSSFNQPVFLGNGIKNIGNGFMRGCTNFASTIFIPPKVESIGGGFCLDCRKFNQDITLPQTITSLGGDYSSASNYGGSFLRGCNNYTSTVDFGELMPGIIDQRNRWDCLATTNSNAPMYTVGVTVRVKAENLNYWKTALPDLHNQRGMYRKINWTVS